jgi:single-stranded DNA-binding protein
MANIDIRGYVKRPETKVSKGGRTYLKFTLSEGIKDDKAPKGKRYEYYNVTCFDRVDGLEDGSYVTIRGYLQPRTYEQAGVKRMSLDVVAKEVDVAPAKSFKSAPATERQPGDDTEEDTTDDPWAV